MRCCIRKAGLRRDLQADRSAAEGGRRCMQHSAAADGHAGCHRAAPAHAAPAPPRCEPRCIRMGGAKCVSVRAALLMIALPSGVSHTFALVDLPFQPWHVLLIPPKSSQADVANHPPQPARSPHLSSDTVPATMAPSACSASRSCVIRPSSSAACGSSSGTAAGGRVHRGGVNFTRPDWRSRRHGHCLR